MTGEIASLVLPCPTISEPVIGLPPRGSLQEEENEELATIREKIGGAPEELPPMHVRSSAPVCVRMCVCMFVRKQVGARVRVRARVRIRAHNP